MIAGICIVVILLAVSVVFLWKAPQNSQESPSSMTISGIMDVNGVIPQGSSITLTQKAVGTEKTSLPFVTNLPVEDGIEWVFSKAKANTSYEIQAILMKGNTIVTRSSPIYVTAPAKGESLTLNVSSESEEGTAAISGTVALNGYIPEGATISVEGRSLGEIEWTTVAKQLPAQNNQFMSYTTAVSGQSYEVRGFLYNSQGEQIGESDIISITAPATNEKLTINSTAQPQQTQNPTQTQSSQPNQPTPTSQPSNGTISGTIDFNGQAQANTRIVIFKHVSGSSDYQVAVDNITPVDGTSWSWTEALAGTSYDLLAIFKQRQSNGTDKDISGSNVITVTAPATNQVFTINSGYSLPAPGGGISVSCGTYNGGSQTWNATVSFGTITGAQSYWFQIGTTNGGVEITNNTQNASGTQNQTISETFQNGVTYFARYAYANIPDQSGGSSEFSPFSQTTQLRCSQ